MKEILQGFKLVAGLVAIGLIAWLFTSMIGLAQSFGPARTIGGVIEPGSVSVSERDEDNDQGGGHRVWVYAKFKICGSNTVYGLFWDKTQGHDPRLLIGRVSIEQTHEQRTDFDRDDGRVKYFRLKKIRPVKEQEIDQPKPGRDPTEDTAFLYI